MKRKPPMTKEQRRQQGRETRAQIRQDARKHPALFTTYAVLRVLVLLVMVREVFNGDYYNVFLCGLTLVLFMIPTFVEHRLHINVPNTLEIIILLFIFSAEILGEIEAYYIRFPFWDTMLHTLNGFLMAAIGFSLVDILNRNERFKFELSPFFVAIVAFCCSMTIGVLWEFFECAMDLFFGQDMQKDTIVHAFSSVMLDPEGANHPIRVSGIYDVAVNGQSLGLGGYLDIGLLDTMKDLFVNFVGALIFSAVGYIYIRNRGKSSIAARFIPRLKKPEADFLEIARERVQEEELEERLSGEERKKKERQREEKPETENVEKGGTDRTS